MKILPSTLFILTTLAYAVSFAGATPAITHSHNGRVHNHPLPTQGLSHQHQTGAPGSINQRENPSTRPLANTQNIKAKGDVNCQLGESNCNVCATNVEQQFRQAARGKIKWQPNSWSFNWPQHYPPLQQRPLDIFDGKPAYTFGIPDKHVQGFVHTNSTRYPYAGSHSHQQRGGVFIIQQQAGKHSLASLHPTVSRHPSGVHTLGKYLVYAEKSSLIFKDIDNPQQQDITLPIPVANSFGGGIGLLRLAGNKHLLITTGPGGQRKAPRFNYFYQLNNFNRNKHSSKPPHLSFLNQSAVIKPMQWSYGFSFSENLTAITECASGDIYTIHTSGDEKGISAIRGKGYWRLSKLQEDQKGYHLKAVNAFSTAQNVSNCHPRSAATVYVNPQHQLEFYCHAYAKDPDGTTFNILGKSSRGKDQFYFKKGFLK